MSPYTKSVFAALAAFCVPPYACIRLMSALDSLAAALGAHITPHPIGPYSDSEILNIDGFSLFVILLVFPLLAILSALTARAFTEPPATCVAWKKTIFTIAVLTFLSLVAVLPRLISADWKQRVIPESTEAYWLAYVIIFASNSLPALWALALALCCKRK